MKCLQILLNLKKQRRLTENDEPVELYKIFEQKNEGFLTLDVFQQAIQVIG